MGNYMVFRAVVPPGFNLDEYAKRSNEPIRFDAVTVVEAESGGDAVNAVIASTGIVAVGFATAEVEMHGFQSQAKFGAGGILTSGGPKRLGNGDAE